MTTICSDPIDSQVRFLNATVVSFNCSLGFGSQESTLTVELVEDCENGDQFCYGNQQNLVGTPQIFSAGVYSFGGIVTNWTENESSGGHTFSVSLADPRRLLEQAMIIVDTYSGPVPQSATNIFNVFNILEGTVNNGNCTAYGSAMVTDRGIPYRKVLQGMLSLNGPIITSPTGSEFVLDLTALPAASLPDFYRVNGPAISILQLVTDVCEAVGCDFYVYMTQASALDRPIIRIQPVSLAQPPSSFLWLINSFEGEATERSYGQELRIDKQKNMIIGEKQHYMVAASDFKPFFGENTSCQAVYATPGGQCGFNLLINVAPLASSMNFPINIGNGYNITELDIRSALGSYELWKNRVLSGNVPGSFNAEIRRWFRSHNVTNDPAAAIEAMSNSVVSSDAKSKGFVDAVNNPSRSDSYATKTKVDEDSKKIHQYIVSLGNTYYGKQYLAKLNQRICFRPSDGVETNGGACLNSEMVYTAVPTNDGGWVEAGGSVIGVTDPYLGFFRQEDGRVGGFAFFNEAGSIRSLDTGSPEEIIMDVTSEEVQ